MLHKLLCYCRSASHPLNFPSSLAGNLTKHMKSKAHSKKCMEMGVPDVLIDDQDAEDSGIYHRLKIRSREYKIIHMCVCCTYVCMFFYFKPLSTQYVWLPTPGHLKIVLPVNEPQIDNIACPLELRWRVDQ